ncbi:MAG: TRAM domain-containing protein [Myxococcota bacterium]
MRRLELVIERLSKSGEGVAELSGRAVFVPGALPGETVLAEVSDTGRALRAELLAILKASLARRAPMCGKATECGGCDWMHVAEDEQVAWKESIVVSALEHLGGVAPGSYERLATIRSPRVLGYRRRATLHPTRGRLGFFGKRSHTRVEIDECPALSDSLAAMPRLLADALGPASRELDEVRLLECEGRVAVSLHAKAQLKPKHRQALEALVRDGVIDGGVLVPGEGRGALETVGEPVLEEDGVLHRPDGFAQANAEVNRALVRHTVELLDLTGGEAVLELYSGNGNFTFPIAERAGSVLAVESAGVSVMLAQAAARKRGAANVRFVQGACEKIAEGLVKEAKRFDRLLLDPPRAGAPGVGLWASRLLVSRVVYVACDPASLARDAAELVANGFRLLALQVFDLFPQTRHVEAVVAFARG